LSCLPHRGIVLDSEFVSPVKIRLVMACARPSGGRTFGMHALAGIKYSAPELLMDFGQRAVILTLNEVRSLIRKPYNNLLEGY
jgi:hypothetical protein